MFIESDDKFERDHTGDWCGAEGERNTKALRQKD